MQPEIIVAIITAIGAIVVAAIASYNSARAANKRDFDSIKKVVIENQLKVNTLWEIYAEDAIRTAQKGGFVASRSPVRPTKKLDQIISEELQSTIESESVAMCEYISSPYDIAIEIWVKHKSEFITKSHEQDIPVRATWGSLVTIVYNALYDAAKIDGIDIPQSMTTYHN